MISSNEGAMGVNATRFSLFFSPLPLTQPVITTFCRWLTLTCCIPCNSLPNHRAVTLPCHWGLTTLTSVPPHPPSSKKLPSSNIKELLLGPPITVLPGSLCSWWGLKQHLHIVAFMSKVLLLFFSSFGHNLETLAKLWEICDWKNWRWQRWFHHESAERKTKEVFFRH